MREKFLKLSWDELNTIRIVCKSCSAVFETTLDKLDAGQQVWTACPMCNHSFLLPTGDGNHQNILQRLGQTVRGLNLVGKTGFAIEIVIPDE